MQEFCAFVRAVCQKKMSVCTDIKQNHDIVTTFLSGVSLVMGADASLEGACVKEVEEEEEEACRLAAETCSNLRERLARTSSALGCELASPDAPLQKLDK